MSEVDRTENDEESSSRWKLMRDVLVFQFKLAMDGLRDILLSPISLTAALVGILTDSKDPAKYFRQLRKLGHQSDRWINLFNTYDDDESKEATADTFIRQAENIVLQEYEKGGVIKDLKSQTDKMIDSVVKDSKKE